MQSASITTPSTNYLYRICEPGCTVCKKPCNGWYMCKECNVKRLCEQFQTSGSKEIDAIIQKSLETAENYWEYWEWIKPKQFKDIEHVANGGFSSVYTATWIDGSCFAIGRRTRQENTVVVLKVPDWSSGNSSKFTAEFLNEVCLNQS